MNGLRWKWGQCDPLIQHVAVSLCQVPAGSGRKALDTQATGFQILVLLICDDKIKHNDPYERWQAYHLFSKAARKFLRRSRST